jgi:hypothetical protein
MEQTVKSGPKDVFLHLFNILTFYVSVIGFITLYVGYITVLFPDPLNFYFTSIANSIRVSTAILFIAVPAYLITSWFLASDLVKVPAKREACLRKWLLYFTLFISAITVIVDLIIFIFNFLSGELTTQFFLKILVVLITAGAVFGYYIWDLKRDDLKSKTPKILAWIVSIVVLGSIVWGFFLIGTPTDQRNRRFDDTRVQNLQELQGQIINYWQQKEALPKELSVLQDSISGFVVPLDPMDKSFYEYKVIDKLSFELCAVFQTSSKNLSSVVQETKPMYYGASLQQNWDHEIGRTCFTRNIDPQLYKPVVNTVDVKAIR